MKIFAGNGNPALAERVSKKLGLELSDVLIGRFSDRELRVVLGEKVAGEKVVIFQPTGPPDSNLLELIWMLSAARLAEQRFVVMPYCGYACQDKDYKNEPESIKVIAGIMKLLSVSGVVVADIHSKHARKAFEEAGIPFYSVCAVHLFVSEVQKNFGSKRITLVAPDEGSCPVVDYYERALGDMVVARVSIKKERPRPDKSKIISIVGEPEAGSDAIVVDDMVRKAGTAKGVARELRKKGIARVCYFSTHGIFCGGALRTLKSNLLDEVWITDTLLQREAVLRTGKVKVISISALLAGAIKCIGKEDWEGLRSLGLPEV